MLEEEKEKEIVVEDNVVKIENEEEEKVETPEVEDSSKEEQPEGEESAFPESFSKKIEGKNEDDLKKMLYESEKFTGKLGTELGNLRKFKRESESPKTAKDIKSRIEKNKGKISSIDKEISELDPELDEDEIADLKQKKKYLADKNTNYSSQHMELFVKEIVDKQGASEHNQKVSNEMRKSFAEKYNQKFSDEDWKAIDEYAENVSKDFRTDPEDYEYALMKAMGIDKYKAVNKSVAEVNVRNSIEKAEAKTVETVGGKGKTYTNIDVEGMSDYQLSNALDKLSDSELERLRKQVNKG